MAKAANANNVNGGDDGPPPNIDYNAVLEIIQTKVHGLESDQKKLSKSARETWDDIEELGVNKKGAQLFSQVLKKPVDKRRDEFRTFINLAKAAGWFSWLDDLVDRAQSGPVVQAPRAAPAPPKPAAAPPGPPPPADNRDLAGERVNLKSGWIQRLKAKSKDKPALDDSDWEDVREATPKELADERERLAADFDAGGPAVDGPKPEPEIAAAREGTDGSKK